MKFSPVPNKSVQRYLNSLFQFKRPLFLLPPTFRRISQASGKDQQNGKRIQRLLQPQSFRINLKSKSSQISIKSLGLYLSPVYVLHFLSNLYIPPWLEKFFKFIRLLENAFVSQKQNLDVFTQDPNETQVIIITPSKVKLPFPLEAFFFLTVCPPQGGRKPWSSYIQNSCRKE